ncbi:unnamed protein product [Durusdinium trenchii]|uniref:Uncharacterized protein n=1 Tax=Durusdinium trenchii TaxID=1381693 RepID=A0ABP0PME0_9DINO
MRRPAVEACYGGEKNWKDEGASLSPGHKSFVVCEYLPIASVCTTWLQQLFGTCHLCFPWSESFWHQGGALSHPSIKSCFVSLRVVWALVEELNEVDDRIQEGYILLKESCDVIYLPGLSMSWSHYCHKCRVKNEEFMLMCLATPLSLYYNEVFGYKELLDEHVKQDRGELGLGYFCNVRGELWLKARM